MRRARFTRRVLGESAGHSEEPVLDLAPGVAEHKVASAEAAATSDGGACKMPVLPDDLLRLIWARHWQQQVASRSACRIQRAVRAAIERAQGDPWDLPALIDVPDVDTCNMTTVYSSASISVEHLERLLVSRNPYIWPCTSVVVGGRTQGHMAEPATAVYTTPWAWSMV